MSSPPMSIGGSRRWWWRSTVTVLPPGTHELRQRHPRFIHPRRFSSPLAVRDRPRRHGDPRRRPVKRRFRSDEPSVPTTRTGSTLERVGHGSWTPQAQHEALTITVERAGQLLGISRGLAYDLVRRGEIPAVRLGRRLVVPARVIEEVLRERSARSRVSLGRRRGPISRDRPTRQLVRPCSSNASSNRIPAASRPDHPAQVSVPSRLSQNPRQPSPDILSSHGHRPVEGLKA